MITADYLVPADAAIEAGGKHYLHGVGWDTILAPVFPVTHPALTLAVLLRVPWHDATSRQTLEIDIHDSDGHSILPNPPGPIQGSFTLGHPPTTERHDLLVPLVFQMMGVIFPKADDYRIVLEIGGVEAGKFSLHLRTMPNSASVKTTGA